MVENEVELVRGCLSGDRISLRAFVERFQGMIFGLCYRMLGHRQDAEDVSQDVFLRVFRNLHRWDQVRPLKPWLLKITANRCRTALEKRSKQPTHVEFAVEHATGKDSNPKTDLAEEVQLGLDQLREEYRTCFVLFYQQELSCAQISDVMECPEGTIKTWLHRARRELAEFLRRRGIAPRTDDELCRI